MRIILRTLFVGLLVLPLIPAHAQSDSVREFKQIQTDREKAIKDATDPITQRYKQEMQAATDPIDVRYQASLEHLLERATREADFDTATKAKAALDLLPQVVAKQLAGTWALQTNSSYTATVTFQSTGTGTHSRTGNFRWRIDGTTLYLGLEDTADRFQLPVKDGKLVGSNRFGLELTITHK